MIGFMQQTIFYQTYFRLHYFKNREKFYKNYAGFPHTQQNTNPFFEHKN